ncbi:MAG: nucleotide sugar dehydrogenase [Salinivirgaceae bacterium]|nr:nucleotide sugar dehydrogenase [Salinivirgaceae bacterium]MDY0278958.1 nucleotide sugar dehydrogenase [Salinivirgaceae bacterium]
MSLYKEISEGKAYISVIGLGYVGLPIALEFAKKTHVVGFDIKEERVAMMRNHIDPSNELVAADFDNTDIEFTTDPEILKKARLHIVAVPTPIDDHRLPDLKPLLSATRNVGGVLKKGDYVVYESTVYPGCTEEDCVPILEELSGLKLGVDFKVGFSPERINPGDKEHTITSILKIVSGSDAEALEEIARVYELIVTAGVHRASSIKVAEAAKIIENTQRDVNIALMNELSMIFNRMKINTFEVLEAAGTKWNFLKFSPGLVGGHCIGVDPYYLLYKAKQLGYHPQMIDSGRSINDGMAQWIASEIVKRIVGTGKNLRESRVLMLGMTFKEDVSDIRNSKVVDLIREFESFMVKVDTVDPHADATEVFNEYGLKLTEAPSGQYDVIVAAVQHDKFKNMKEKDFKKWAGRDAIFVDIKGVFKHEIKDLTYWSL